MDERGGEDGAGSITLLFPKPTKREKKPKRLKARGDKTDAWEEALAELKVRFQIAGVTECELRWEGCWRNNALSFAHSKKRRKVSSPEELRECILACVPCHNRLEYGQNMYDIVRRVIASRKVQP
jgi:hypothetical protein